MENYLIHYGNKNSGRYPRGSGENPHQHDGLLYKLKKKHEEYKNRPKDPFNKKFYNEKIKPLEGAMKIAKLNYKAAKNQAKGSKKELKREKKIYKLSKSGINRKIAKLKYKQIKNKYKAEKMSKKTAKTTYKEACDKYDRFMSDIYGESTDLAEELFGINIKE